MKTRGVGFGALVAAALAGAGLAGGCGYNENGRAASLDQATYTSTELQPKTVTLVDIRDQQEIWSVEVPVGQKVVIRFFDQESGNPYRPAVMKWALVPEGKGGPGLRLANRLDAPPPNARRVEWTLRRGPELSGELAPPPLPGEG